MLNRHHVVMENQRDRTVSSRAAACRADTSRGGRGYLLLVAGWVKGRKVGKDRRRKRRNTFIVLLTLLTSFSFILTEIYYLILF